MLLEEKHFDESYMNPHFVYYLNAHLFKPGDSINNYEFSIWVCSKATEYKNQFDKDDWTSIGSLPGAYEAFGEYLKSFSVTTETEQLSFF